LFIYFNTPLPLFTFIDNLIRIPVLIPRPTSVKSRPFQTYPATSTSFI